MNFNTLVDDNLPELNVDLLIMKQLYDGEKVNDRYYTLLKNYKILLEKYLISKLKLNEYDKKISNSNLNFEPVKNENMDYYQLISTMGLKYIYLRNDLYVEKLSIDVINRVVNLSNAELLNPSEELYDLINNTYHMVIDSNHDKGIKQMNCYGPDGGRFWMPSDELVFGVRHDEFALHGMNDDEWEENYFNQLDYLNDLRSEMETESSEVLGIKTNYILYNDFTVKSLKSQKKI